MSFMAISIQDADFIDGLDDHHQQETGHGKDAAMNGPFIGVDGMCSAK